MAKTSTLYFQVNLVRTVMVLALAVASVSVAHATSQTRTTTAALEHAINQGNEFMLMDLLGEVQRSVAYDIPVDSAIIKLLIGVWENRNTEYPEINWPMARSDSVRTFVGSTLLFLDKRGLYEAKKDDYREFARAIIERPNAKNIVVANAIRMLGTMDDAADVSTLKKVALSADQLKFRTAVLVLGEMCVTEAREALIDLRSQVDSGRKTFIEEQMDKFGGLSGQVRGCVPK